MMKVGKVIFFISVVTACVVVSSSRLMAAGPPPPPPPPPAIPIDGGISFLIAAGAAYGGKKVLDRGKKNS